MEILLLKLCDFKYLFLSKLDKISSPLLKLRRKTLLSQFQCSQISFKLCTCVCQTLRRTNYSFNWYAVNKEATFPWKVPHHYEVYEESHAKCSCGIQEVKLS